MERITRVAAFTGDQGIETAISERLESMAQYIEDYGLTLPDGRQPPDDWPCAIFKPEAGMHRFDLGCSFDGQLWTVDACERYNLPEGTETAVYMGLVGSRSVIEDFCQAICDLSRLTCHIMEDVGDKYRLVRTLSPSGDPKPKSEFIDLMFEAMEW